MPDEPRRPHPLILELFAMLPERPQDRWPMHQRVAWLRAAAACFEVLYAPTPEGRITVVGKTEPARPAPALNRDSPDPVERFVARGFDAQRAVDEAVALGAAQATTAKPK